MAVLSGLIRVMEKAARKAGGRLRRDFGEVALETRFHIAPHDPLVRLHTRMHNRGKGTLTGLESA